MRQIDKQESKSIQIEMLAEIDRYCKNNNLMYFMSYGTLLGAVRHNGFIPWDDDIDIAMPYPDFKRFCQSYKNDIYKVNYWAINPSFHCNYAKFEDTRTLSEEDIDLSYQIGINIDIAPIIGLPDNYRLAYLYFLCINTIRSMLTIKKIKQKKERSVWKRLELALLKCFCAPFSFYSINKMIDSLSSKYQFDTSKYAICVGSFNPAKEIIQKETFNQSTKLSFENYSFNAPSKYDLWLKQIFGNYMKLPDESKRVSRHTFKNYWVDK